jgi:TonB family protein
MGFFFRKSVKFGPLRFNFSKSGVGVSAGVRGARVSAGPRGTYINVGRNGFYYRQKIHIPMAQPQSRPHDESRQGFHPPSSHSSDVYNTESSGAESYTDTTLENTLSEINEKLNKSDVAPLVLVLLILLSAVLLLGLAYSGIVLSVAYAHQQPGDEQLLSTFNVIAWTCGIALVPVTLCGILLKKSIRKRDRLGKSTQLFYELDAPVRARHNKILQAFEALAQSSLVWSQQTQQATYDWKRNAGASTLVSRRRIAVGMFQPPGIETNVPVCGFNFGGWQLFFMPDNVFVLNGGRYYAYPYGGIQKKLSDTRFVEDGYLPPDATVVDYTWLRVNRDGDPDRRFNYNRQIPVVRYGVIELASASGLNVHLQVSSLQHALEFANLWNKAFSSPGDSKRKATTDKAVNKEEYVNGKPAYEILGVRPGASLEELNATYREKAKQYHPDRVEGLGPELKSLAVEKMKEINAAYAALKGKAGQANKGNAGAGGNANVEPSETPRDTGDAPSPYYVPRMNPISLKQGSSISSWVLGGVLITGLLLCFLVFTIQFLNSRTTRAGRVQPPTNTTAVPNANVNINTNAARVSKKQQGKIPSTNKNTNVPNGNAASDVYLVSPAEEAPGGNAVDYSRIFTKAEVTRPAVITSKPEPGFTEEARKNIVTGVVRLRAIFSATGEVTNITVIKELPDGLTYKAVAAAKQIRFTPADKDGHAVSQYVTLEYNFNIY